MEININFKHYRELAHLSQKEAAEKLNIPAYVLSNYELGRSEPKLETLINMCYLYKCDANELLGVNRLSAKSGNNKYYNVSNQPQSEEIQKLLEEYLKTFEEQANNIINKK